MSTKIKEIFDHISETEGHEFEINQQYLNKTPFQIETSDGYADVVSMMIKSDIGLNVSTDSGEILISKGHKIMTADGIRLGEDLKVGTVLSNKNGDTEVTALEEVGEVLVYDLTIDKEDHLYLDSNGFVHHNTFHITEGPRSLKALLGPEGDKWTYHSGTKAAPFSFYNLLFQERNSIIVFDEADSLLKNPDIVMMLKPILDTSGDNMAEYMSGTENMVGRDVDAIEDYSEEVDAEIAAGAEIGTGKNDVKLPSKFKFTGGMVFISNMKASQIESAIMSRSIFIDVHLAQQDVVKRIRSIARKMSGSMGLKEEEADDIVDALSEGSESVGADTEIRYMTPELARKSKQLTVRAYQLAAILKTSGLSRWKELSQLYA